MKRITLLFSIFLFLLLFSSCTSTATTSAVAGAQQVGFQTGYSVGHEEGYNQGYDQGHNAGYNEGFAIGQITLESEQYPDHDTAPPTNPDSISTSKPTLDSDPVIVPEIEQSLASDSVPTPETDPPPEPAHESNPPLAPDYVPMPKPEPTEASIPVNYIVNKNTGKFHYPSCSSVDEMKEINKLYWPGTRDELTDMGYVPCKRCNP